MVGQFLGVESRLIKHVKSAVPLSAEQLSSRFSLSTDDIRQFKKAHSKASLIGQERAISAIQMSARMIGNGFNVFVMGKPGHGRWQAVNAILAQEASKLDPVSDWVYTYNFEEPDKPRALELPSGMAIELKHAMNVLVDDLATEIPAIFESEDYQNRRRSIEQEFGEHHEKAFADVMENAQKKQMTLLRTPMGFVIASVKDGKPLSPEQFQQLPENEQQAIEATIAELQSQLEQVLRNIPKNEKERRRAVEALNRGMATDGVDDAIGPVLSKFAKVETITNYLDLVRQDLIENAELFLETSQTANAGAFPVATTKRFQEPQFRRYLVNVMICNTPETGSGAPVVTEDLPTLGNIIGRIEHISQMGTLVTDFTMIKPGALHKANGGYLILDIQRVLSEPFAWDALKRCIQSEQISIVSAQERFSLVSTASLQPDPIPLNVRIALVGERRFFYLLTALDPDFASLFKVQADFDDETNISDATIGLYVAKISDIIEQQAIRTFDAGAINAVLAEMSRLADDREKFSLDVEQATDILREAEFWAASKNAKRVTATFVERAIEQAEARANRPREQVHQAIANETMLIDTSGGVVGQINALSVHQIGKFRFGRPSRVTARTRMGKGRVVDIEREVDLGGPLHSKGVLILSGYLASHFALDAPMSLWASIVFEQSYGGVDGDSASAAELFCLLSSLSQCPIDQSYAVTGSINQHGQIQAIGGVNEKIEGFFDVCEQRGLSGRQGVLIPKSNVRNLSLRSRVVDAVKAGKFSITPIETADEGIAILTGVDAGNRDATGCYADNTINGLVEQKLRQFASDLRRFAKQGEKEERPDSGDAG